MNINGATLTAPIPETGTSRTSTRNVASPQDFYKLLITQLQSQDPLKPTDNQAVLEQISMIRQLESSEKLNQTLAGMSSDQRLGSMASLIGKYVVGRADTAGGDQTAVQGVVVGVTYTTNGQAVLELHNGQRLPADKVEAITLVDNLPAGTPAPPAAAAPAATTPTASPTARTKLNPLAALLNQVLTAGEN